MIDTAMLAAMREAIEQLLPDTCTIQSVTRTADGMGGMTETWATAYSKILCRLDAKMSTETLAGGGLQAFKQYTLSLPYDTTITVADPVVHSGITYNVTAVNTSQSWTAVKRVIVEAI